MSAFTTQQTEALERAYDLLGEHFDGVLIAVLANVGEDQPQEAVRIYYYGGRAQAIGLAMNAQHELLGVGPDKTEP